MKKFYSVLLCSGVLFSQAFAQGDNCATAVPVTPGTYVADGPSVGGGANNSCAGYGGANADWYSFVPSCDGSINVNSCFGGADTKLQVYSGDCGTLACVGSSDDFCNTGFGSFYASEVNATVTAGVTYYIQWDNYWTTAGFTWSLTYTPSSSATGITTSAITSTGATSTWTDGTATDWTIEYGLSGFVLGTGTTANVLTQSYNFTGLQPETSYEYYIQAGTGCFVGPYAFTTLPICPVPTAPNITGLTPTTATLNWTAGGMETIWDVEWGTSGFLLGAGTQDYGLLTYADPLTGLTGSTDYHWYVRAVCDLNTGDGVDTMSYFVGPLSFTTTQVCAMPSGLAESNNTGFATDLTWSAGGLETEWNVVWGEAGFTPGGSGSNAVNGVTSLPVTVTGLVPNTDYQFYVQAVCGSTPDSLSPWVGPYNWTTIIYCNDPSALGSSAYTTTGADLDWTAGGLETSWNLEYGLNGFTPGTGTSSVETSTIVSLTGLTPGTDYCYYVQAICGTGTDSSSNWVGPHCFSTLVACPEPTNLGVINVTNTAANLLWQAGGSETSWNIEWGLPGFVPGAGEEVGSVAGTSSNPYYATGMTASNSYEFYVQADCGGTDGVSIWAGPFSFNTILTNDTPCDAIELGVDGIIRTYSNALATYNGEIAVPGGAGCNDPMAWCGYGYENKPMWFKFKATATGNALISTINDVTSNYNSLTEIAVYSVGLCENYGTYTMLAANTGNNPGSESQICSGLTSGDYYYIMVDAYTYDMSGWGIGPESTPFSGPFGISIEGIPAADAGTSVGLDVCENSGSIDLFMAITGNSSTNGTWYNPSVAPGNEVSNVIDLTGVPAGTYPFFYVEGTSCGTDTTETAVNIESAPSAGGDNAVTACNSGDIYLIQMLSGLPQMGGTWSDDDATGVMVNGIFQSDMFAAGTYNFTYTVTSGGACPDETATVTVTLNDCVGLGIADNTTEVLSVYPNPVMDVLTIQNLNITSGVIEVLDVQGKLVKSIQISGITGNYNLDMSAFERGVYVVRITTENTIQETRVVKQ